MANEPDIIQKLSVDFNVVQSLPVDLGATPKAVGVQLNQNSTISANFSNTQYINAQFNSDITPIQAQFGTVYVVSGDCRVLYATTATWNSQPTLISDRGYLYIYSDYKKTSDDKNIAGFKVGDGTSYLIDMPFTDILYDEHISNDIIHITQQEREFWNNKVRCYLDPVNEQNLIFTTH